MQRPPDNPGIVPHFAGSQNHTHSGQGNTAEQRNHKGSVPVVEAVDGEGRPSPEEAAAGTHGVGFQGKGRDHPGNQHGEYPQTIDNAPEDVALIAAPANAFLRQIDAPCLLADSRNQSQ